MWKFPAGYWVLSMRKRWRHVKQSNRITKTNSMDPRCGKWQSNSPFWCTKIGSNWDFERKKWLWLGACSGFWRCLYTISYGIGWRCIYIYIAYIIYIYTIFFYFFQICIYLVCNICLCTSWTLKVTRQRVGCQVNWCHPWKSQWFEGKDSVEKPVADGKGMARGGQFSKIT